VSGSEATIESSSEPLRQVVPVSLFHRRSPRCLDIDGDRIVRRQAVGPSNWMLRGRIDVARRRWPQGRRCSTLDLSRHQALTEAERADVAAALETSAPGDSPNLDVRRLGAPQAEPLGHAHVADRSRRQAGDEGMDAVNHDDDKADRSLLHKAAVDVGMCPSGRVRRRKLIGLRTYRSGARSISRSRGWASRQPTSSRGRQMALSGGGQGSDRRRDDVAPDSLTTCRCSPRRGIRHALVAALSEQISKLSPHDELLAQFRRHPLPAGRC
jgi:hypothetical protein